VLASKFIKHVSKDKMVIELKTQLETLNKKATLTKEDIITLENTDNKFTLRLIEAEKKCQ
jgi:hypothetical protein